MLFKTKKRLWVIKEKSKLTEFRKEMKEKNQNITGIKATLEESKLEDITKMLSTTWQTG